MAVLSLTSCFTKSFLKRGQKRAITFLRDGEIESEISYLQLDRDSNQMANALLDMNIKKGDRVIIFLPNSLFFVVAHVAIQKIGAIGVPLNPGYKKTEMSYFINDLDPRLLISGPEHEAMIMEIPSRLTNLVCCPRSSLN